MNRLKRTQEINKNKLSTGLKLVCTFLLAITFSGAFSQVDTTEYQFGKRRIIIINAHGDTTVDEWDDFDMEGSNDSDSTDKDENYFEAIGAFQFGVNGYMTPENSLNLPQEMSLMEIDYSKSRSFAFNLMWYTSKMRSSSLYISPGIGLDYKSYFFKNNVNISTGNDTVLFALDTVNTYKKYKFRATYLQVPLILGARIGSGDTQLQIQAGVIGGYNIGALVKTKIEADGTRYKNKVKDDYNLSPFKLTATARVGIGNVGFFANYGLTSLFQKNKSPELIPFTIGVQIGGF
ncbi:MAG: outer membrane beta-barrel protein [Flavobacteriales bacterium]|nr:outer membrane beta-barrel protein [Flavobacteriales bacterium]